MRFRKKNTETFEAIQFKGTENYYDALEFLGREKADRTDPENAVMVKIGDGVVKVFAKPGMWITRDSDGIFAVVSDEDFQANFEPAE